MARENIQERRVYIKVLLERGEEFNVREVARMWNSSYPSIIADIAVCKGERDPYYKKQSQVVAQNARARRLGIEGRLSEHDWRETLEAHGNCCTHCKTTENLAIDHVIPLSRGGKNIRGNIQPLCESCNTSKGNKLPDEWAARSNGRKGGRPRKRA